MDKQISLTKAQINQLFEFTKKKYVHYEDLRYELVDHLASDIEAQMVADSSVSFKSALDITYGKFPITGFSKFVEQKEKSLNRYWFCLLYTSPSPRDRG